MCEPFVGPTFDSRGPKSQRDIERMRCVKRDLVTNFFFFLRLLSKRRLESSFVKVWFHLK